MVAFHCLQGGVSPIRVALYARISTHDQQTLVMQMDAMHEFATRRGWTVSRCRQDAPLQASSRSSRSLSGI